MLEVKVTGANVGEITQQLEEVLLSLSGQQQIVVAEEFVKSVVKKKAAKKAKKKTTKAAAKAEVVEEVKEESKEPGSPDGPIPQENDVSPNDVLEALQKLNNEKGLAAAKEVLSKFGANRYSEIQVKDHAEFVAACEKAMS